MEIQKLQKKFIGSGEVAGVEFEKVAENEKAYIYKCAFEKNTYFEVFEKKVSPICLNFKKKEFSTTDFKEIYPKAKSFGVWAFTTPNFEHANEIFNNLKNKQNG